MFSILGKEKAKMENLAEQLAFLRQKVAGIDRKFADARTRPLAYEAPPQLPAFAEGIETVLSGDVVETAGGKHFETEKLYGRQKRHGSVSIGDLFDLPSDLLGAISGGTIANSHPSKWAFLDTETTGLMGGSGTYAFLVGIGSIDASGFRVRQFFMRDFGEEKSQLARVSEYLAGFDVLVTYNGKTFDKPLLETRYTMCRMRNPFGRMEHLDLLTGSRRLWKLRLENCRLSYLENQILGVERHGDLPGEMIPHYYFEFVRTQRALSLVPILHHNAMDIVTLACLMALVPQTFQDPARVEARHGADLLGLAKWLVAQQRSVEAIALMRRAVQIGMPDRLLFPTLFEVGMLEKKQGNEAAAVELFAELVTCKNACRGRAYEELAKYYEHRERSYAMALEMTRAALSHEVSAGLVARAARLEKKVNKTGKFV
jgi:uncharacterized protein YprB with RNaseH-like and TPR domain